MNELLDRPLARDSAASAGNGEPPRMGATRQTPKGSATGRSNVRGANGSAQRPAESVSFSHILYNPVQAHQVLNDKVWPLVKSHTIAGTQLRLHVESLEDFRSAQQNAFYWAFVLKTISQQAVINGIGAQPEGWHYKLKKDLLGYRKVKVKVPGSKRAIYTRELRSTTKLKVKAMSIYLEKVMAKAATEWGVTFDADMRWEDWQVDSETGEMTQ